MRAGRNKPGSSTDFVDSATAEVLLRVACSAVGESILAFRLYDQQGQLIAANPEFTSFPDGLLVTAGDGEVLLNVPANLEGNLIYRLYSSAGRLLTCSDGVRTQVFPFLRMEKGKVAPPEVSVATKKAIPSVTT